MHDILYLVLIEWTDVQKQQTASRYKHGDRYFMYQIIFCIKNNEY